MRKAGEDGHESMCLVNRGTLVSVEVEINCKGESRPVRSEFFRALKGL